MHHHSSLASSPERNLKIKKSRPPYAMLYGFRIMGADEHQKWQKSVNETQSLGPDSHT